MSEAESGMPPVSTQEAPNQAPPLVDYDLYSTDTALVEAVSREGAADTEAAIRAFGRLMGSQRLIEAGFDANRYLPELASYDRFGTRIDEVRFHPAWHDVMRASVEAGLHNLPWQASAGGHGHAARAALTILAAQNETGHLCPISMTNSVVPVLRKHPDLAAAWEPGIASRDYDPRFLPAGQKRSVLLGMALTERQGGSDVRANTSVAEPAGREGTLEIYRITGQKWFCSAPMCDGFLVLAQTGSGLGCFLLPRWTPDGRRNRFFIQRLKDKLGNRSNASAEVGFDAAYSVLIGEPGRGVATIADMINLTRFDCILASTGFMRQALVQAVHHARHRSAFGRRLIEQPLMKNVLTDLSLEAEAATVLAMRIGRAYDESASSESAAAFCRLVTAIGKYWVCKRAPYQVCEAMECLGGNGYIEESILPRTYREAPLTSIWEGCGNINVLDAMRAAGRDPRTVEALFEVLREARGANRHVDTAIGDLERDAALLGQSEIAGRRHAEKAVLTLQGALLVRFAPPAVSDAFCSSRLGGDWGHAFGTLSDDVNFDAILERSVTPVS